MSNFTRRSLLLSAAGLAGMSALPLRRARADGEVNIYSARHYPADEQLFARFTEETGIAVNQIKGTGSELMERIKLEGEQSPASPTRVQMTTPSATSRWTMRTLPLPLPLQLFDACTRTVGESVARTLIPPVTFRR